MKLDACFSHNKDDWETPRDLYNHLINNKWIDPCPLFSKEDNLNKIYPDCSRIYINPPYSKIKEWVEFIQKNKRSEILLLIPSRTDTNYFNELASLKPFIYFIKGRLKFGDSKSSAPFPSILMYFTPYQIIRIPLYTCMTLKEFIQKFN